MPSPLQLTARAALLRTVQGLPREELVYAYPRSTRRPLAGRTVEVSGLCLAIRTDAAQVVWVHAEDCPDLVRRSGVKRSGSLPGRVERAGPHRPGELPAEPRCSSSA
jgi:hypothetical protein